MSGKDRNTVHASRALGAGLTFAGAVALFTVGGLWLDERAGTKPLFVLVGVLLGLLGGTIHLLAVLAPEMLPFGRKPPKDGSPPDNP